VFGGGATLTVNVTGARLNVPAVVFDVSVALTVAVPCAPGVTVTIGPVVEVTQLVNVMDDGLTVATDVLLDDSAIEADVAPVRLSRPRHPP
jgi:hypothetical protein